MTKILFDSSAKQGSKKFSIRRLKSLIVKESFQIVRDPSSILISIILPLFLMFLYGYGVSLDLNHLRMGLVMEDTSPTAQSFARSFYNSPYFDVSVSPNRKIIMRDLEKGSIRGFVVIPSYFTQFFLNSKKIAPIQAIGDGSEPNTARFFQNYVEGAYQNWRLQELVEGKLKNTVPAALEPRFWYNEQLESRNFLLPGSLAIIMTLIGTLLTALVVSREWERGTMESLISTPISVSELILGKFIPYFFLGLVSMGLCFLVTVFGFSVPFRGSLLFLLGVTSSFLFCALGLGLMISTLSKNQVVAYQVAVVTGFLPAYILSGFLFEISSMPIAIRLLTYLMPARYFVQSLQTLFLAGNIKQLVFFNALPLILLGSVFFVITIKKTVKRLDG